MISGLRKSINYFGLIAGVLLILLSLPKYMPTAEPDDLARSLAPRPPFPSASNRFACTGSAPDSRTTKRVAVLNGPDWKVESAIDPKCLPEHRFIFSTEVGRGLLSRAISHRLGFSVTKRNNLIYVKEWQSSGNKGLDETVLEMVTNHNCQTRRGKNCRIDMAATAIPIRID